jgi:hypothetical protein
MKGNERFVCKKNSKKSRKDLMPHPLNGVELMGSRY